MTNLAPSRAEQEIDRLLGIHPRGFDLSLDRIARLLDDLGRPQDKMPPVIHVAGTNGKGSATAFSRALLEAQGLAVHVHTSPHLVRWHERYRIGVKGGPGRLVSDEMLLEAVLKAERVNAGQTITVFELLTAVIFILFAENPADAAVIEVGLEYNVGVGGKRLPASQRQKLGIARALIKRPQLVVVNEAVAMFDGRTQDRIRDNILADALEGDRGVFWIANRPNQAEPFEQIVVMQGGRVVAQGSPSDLAAKGGLYTELMASA